MTLLTFVLTIVILGVIAWLIYRYIPMPEVAKTVLNVVFVLVVVFLLLALFGIMDLPFRLK